MTTRPRAEVCRILEQVGLVPVVRTASAELALQAVDALLLSGIAVAEITLTVPDAIGVIREVKERYGAKLIAGAGTVCNADEARAAVEAGASFVVSPGFDPEIVRAAHALDVPAIPGVLTPTEIMAAMRAGADWVKIFPCAAVGGAQYLRALRGPFPGLKLMPTGGITLTSVPEYIAAGATALGVGSELVDPKELEAGELNGLRKRARMFGAALRAARSTARTDSRAPNS
jgi:2-dehydro-3-deoxyphosphogluconate aldolase/(4S)-4-hydroxy-2-oxoglutarate aldolase